MEISYLKEFTVLARSLNYSEAAAELHISQSNLSRHIQAIERELGGELFDRSSRRVSLSALGALYLPYAEKISAAYAEAEKTAQAHLRKRRTDIPFGAVRNVQYYHVSEFLLGFQHSEPNCRFSVIEGSDPELTAMFRARRFNLFATYLPLGGTADFGFIPAGEGHVVAYLSREDPLARGGPLTPDALASVPLLMPSHSTLLSHMLRDAFAAAGVTPTVIYEGGLAGAMDYVRAGLGVALQPMEYPLARDEKNVVCLDVAPPISYRYGLAFRTDGSLSAAERRFVDYVRRMTGAQTE